MIPKSGNRFSEKGHAQTRGGSGMTIRRKIIPLQIGRGPRPVLLLRNIATGAPGPGQKMPVGQKA
jgi:hypothetical protein